jgi:hypothetical protein
MDEDIKINIITFVLQPTCKGAIQSITNNRSGGARTANVYEWILGIVDRSTNNDFYPQLILGSLVVTNERLYLKKKKKQPDHE